MIKHKFFLVSLFVCIILGSLAFIKWNDSTIGMINSLQAQETPTTTKPEQLQPVGLQIGYYAPDFTLENLAGEKVSLSDFRGKYVLLNFWAIWCPPCRAEMPDLNRFHLENEDEMIVLGVELGTPKRDVVKFIEEGKYEYPILLDLKKETERLYRITAIPTTYVLNREGRILSVIRGAISYEQLNQIRDILLTPVTE